MDTCHVKNSELEPTIPKNTTVELYSEATLWKMIQALTQYVQSKSNGCHSKATRLWRTSRRRSIRLHSGKIGGRSKVSQTSKVRVSRYLGASTTTQMAKIMVQYGRPSRSSWTKFVRTSFGRTVMGKPIRESSIGTQLGKSFKLGMNIRTPWKGVIHIRVCGWHQTGWKETKQRPNVESTFGRSRFGRAKIIPWPRLFGLHSMRRCCGQLQKYVWNQDLRRSQRKATLVKETWSKHYLMVVWHGR